MSRFVGSVGRDAELVHMSTEPFDLDGARPVPSILTKTVEDVEEFVQRGPAISLSALVCFLIVVGWCGP
jgi:hypothetical protein